MDSRLDLFRAVYAEYRETQCLQLLSAFSLENTHLLSGSFQFYKRTLAAKQQDQSIRHTVHALTGEFKGLPTGGPDCFHNLLFFLQTSFFVFLYLNSNHMVFTYITVYASDLA